MRRRVALTVLIALAVATAGSVARASTSRVRSEPNGDLSLTVSVGCGATDRDQDGDFNTCTKGDEGTAFYAVFNNSAVPQTVHIDYVLDGPGTDLDRSFSKDVLLAPGGDDQELAEFRVQNKRTPLGDYTLTVTATGSEKASTSAGFTVH